MTVIKRLIYIGKDEELFEQLQFYCQSHIRSPFELKQIEYNRGTIIDHQVASSPNIVYVDFTYINAPATAMKEIVLLRKYKRFKSTLFVAIMANSPEKSNLASVFTSGIQLSFIKGTEIDHLCFDSLYIGLTEKLPVVKYAKARKIGKELEVGMCSTLTSISKEYFSVETDLEVSNDFLPMELPLFKELKARSFRVESHKTCGHLNPMTDTYLLKFPFVGPWDELTEETIQEETVETWLDFNQENLSQKYCFLKVITKNCELSRHIFEHQERSNYFVDFQEVIEFENLKQDFQLKRPNLIFFDLEEDPNGDNNLDNIFRLINEIKTMEDYRPIFIITNTLSKTDAMQKVLGYTRLIATSEELSPKVLTLLCDKFDEKIKKNANDDGHFFPLSDSRRVIEVFHKVIVTSLTEHEVTFISPIDLPMYTVIHLHLPISCYVTLVPPIFDLERSVSGEHYLGLIHGAEEDDIKLLRKFVNQIIFTRIEAFTQENVEMLLEQKEVDTTPETQESKEKPDKSKKEEIQYKTFEKPQIKGKSKL